MIIQVRGTSGSGKSTVVKQVMGNTPWCSIVQEGRRRPLYYVKGDVAVLGHYETACGGCDTIGSAAKVFELIQDVLQRHSIVLCEGLLLSEDTKWSKQLPDLTVYFLTTPLERCIKQIKQRRLEAGNTKELNTTNTEKRVKVIERARVKLLEAGIKCRRVTCKQAVELINGQILQHA